MSSWDVTHGAIIKGGLQFSGVHERITEWIESVPGAHYDKSRGCSYINGAIFFNHVVFLNAEDLLAFMLVFSDSVYPVVDLNENILDRL